MMAVAVLQVLTVFLSTRFEPAATGAWEEQLVAAVGGSSAHAAAAADASGEVGRACHLGI